MAPLLFLVGVAGGFISVSEGLMPMLSEKGVYAVTAQTASADIAYIPLDPIVINLAAHEPGRFLRFQAQIEVSGPHRTEVASLVPRLMDVLNGYLRAVDAATLEDRTALVRLKSQMLRRIQLVVGGGKVRDLLVMEFVVS